MSLYVRDKARSGHHRHRQNIVVVVVSEFAHIFSLFTRAARALLSMCCQSVACLLYVPLYTYVSMCVYFTDVVRPLRERAARVRTRFSSVCARRGGSDTQKRPRGVANRPDDLHKEVDRNI